MPFPLDIRDVETELNRELKSKFRGERTGFVQVGPKKYLLSAGYRTHSHKYFNFPLRNDDVWIVTYPRSGTTLMQELVWMIMNDLDFEKSAKDDLLHRSPFLEFSCFQHEDLIAEVRDLNGSNPESLEVLEFLHKPGYEILSDMPSPRIIKTHLPFSLLPPELTKRCKVIYSARNPKDVCESYFHHNKLIKFHDYIGEFKDYWDCFERDLVLFSPFFEHVKEGWDLKDNPCVYFLFYEDLMKDMKGGITKIARFLNKSFSESQIEALVKHLQIDNFRKNVHFIKPVLPGLTNENSQQFIRKGQTGKNDLYTIDLAAKSNAWIAEEITRTGVQFPI